MILDIQGNDDSHVIEPLLHVFDLHHIYLSLHALTPLLPSISYVLYRLVCVRKCRCPSISTVKSHCSPKIIQFFMISHSLVTQPMKCVNPSYGSVSIFQVSLNLDQFTLGFLRMFTSPVKPGSSGSVVLVATCNLRKLIGSNFVSYCFSFQQGTVLCWLRWLNYTLRASLCLS